MIADIKTTAHKIAIPAMMAIARIRMDSTICTGLMMSELSDYVNRKIVIASTNYRLHC